MDYYDVKVVETASSVSPEEVEAWNIHPTAAIGGALPLLGENRKFKPSKGVQEDDEMAESTRVVANRRRRVGVGQDFSAGATGDSDKGGGLKAIGARGAFNASG